MNSDASDSAAAAVILGRYRIDGKLGEGGLGTVMRAFDTRLKRTVAIKTIKHLPSGSREDSERFHDLEARFAREAEAGSRMGVHPNLVAVYDLIVDPGGTQYLILEYVQGGTVAERVARGPLPLAEALAITADAAAGLQAAHEHGIVHRDVKPSNIFLGEDGHAKLGDFGVAQIDELSRRTQSAASHPGTPLYMSPELTAATSYARPSSDQYSLGLVLFEMLTGKAYKRLERPEVESLLVAQPKPVQALLARLLAEDPAARYPSMATVHGAARALEPDRETATGYATELTVPETRASDGQTASLPPATATERRMSRRALLAGVGGLALVAGAAGAALATRHGATPLIAAGTSAPAPPTAVSTRSASPPITPTVTADAPVVASTPAGAAIVASPAASIPVRTSVSSLLSYLDGKVTLPGEPRDYSDSKSTILGGPVTVVGLDLAGNQPRPLPAVSAPAGSRTIRTLWAPRGTQLAILTRNPVSGGYSDTIDLSVVDIATGISTTVAKGINSLPSWSPDGTTLVYALIGEPRLPPPESGMTSQMQSYDIHLVNSDGKGDRVVANIVPYSGGCGGNGKIDPIELLVDSDQFVGPPQSTAWAADGSRIALYVGVSIYTMKSDASDLRQIGTACGGTFTVGPDLGAFIGATTADPYAPANGIKLRLVDDPDALQWRYERGLFPTKIIDGVESQQIVVDGKSVDSDVSRNTRSKTLNAGYRNQIVATFPDGSERKITGSPTFKYHIEVSPDGTAVAFTGITVSDYDAASNHGRYPLTPFTGYSIDVYLVRTADGTETRLTTTGTAHHPSWERDVPVKAIPVAITMPKTAPTSTPVPRLASWADAEQKISLSYDTNVWRATRDTTDQFNILKLDSADGTSFYLGKYVRGSSDAAGNALQGIQGYKDRQLKRTDRKYTQLAIQQTQIDGGTAAYMEFRSTSTTNGSDVRIGVVWYVDGPDRQFVIEVIAIGNTVDSRKHLTNANPVINSIRLST